MTEKARQFGAGALFNQILPLLMSPSLEDQERHLLVKVIDRILYKLDDLVRPYVHKVREVYFSNSDRERRGGRTGHASLCTRSECNKSLASLKGWMLNKCMRHYLYRKQY